MCIRDSARGPSATAESAVSRWRPHQKRACLGSPKDSGKDQPGSPARTRCPKTPPGRRSVRIFNPVVVTHPLALDALVCCGADRDRTGGLLNAIEALSQLSYSPSPSEGAMDYQRPFRSSRACASLSARCWESGNSRAKRWPGTAASPDRRSFPGSIARCSRRTAPAGVTAASSAPTSKRLHGLYPDSASSSGATPATSQSATSAPREALAGSGLSLIHI